MKATLHPFCVAFFIGFFMTTYSNAKHWQPAINPFSLESVGVVEGVADVEQAIHLILTTPLGSDVHRPDFGNEGLDYIDADPDVAMVHLVRTCPQAILRFEPRVKSVTVTTYFDQLKANLVAKVQYVLADGVARDVEITL